MRSIDATNAHGTTLSQRRKLQYSADGLLWISCDGDGQKRSDDGAGNAQLVTTREPSETNIAARPRGDELQPSDRQGERLSHVAASGNAW